MIRLIKQVGDMNLSIVRIRITRIKGFSGL
jgi:hypothetical protein